MNIPSLSPEFDGRTHWKMVASGEAQPNEWEAALMAVVESALAAGVFYATDLDAYARQSADFVPAEFWELQFPGTPVEGGVMGMELYYARDAVNKAKDRVEIAAATARLNPSVGQKLGVLFINGKRVTSCAIVAIDGPTLEITGKRGANVWKYTLNARAVENCIQKAIDRGWRK